MGCRGRTEMSLVFHRSTPLLYIQKKLRIAPRHERFRNAPNIRNPAPRQLLCAFAWRIPHVWRSENVCKCSCEHGICSRFPRCFLHIRQEAAVLDISVSAAVFFYEVKICISYQKRARGKLFSADPLARFISFAVFIFLWFLEKTGISYEAMSYPLSDESAVYPAAHVEPLGVDPCIACVIKLNTANGSCTKKVSVK